MTSRLALASLITVLVWYAACAACVAYMYSTRGALGQRWDLVPVIWVCWAGWLPFCVAGIVLGVLALRRIRSSGGRLGGAWAAAAGIAMSLASVGVGLVAPYLADLLP